MANSAPMRFLDNITTASARRSRKARRRLLEYEKMLLLPRRASASRSSGWKMTTSANASKAVARVTSQLITVKFATWETKVRTTMMIPRPTRI